MSDENYQKCLGQLPVAAFALNQTGKIVAWNDAAASSLGKTAASVGGKKAWTVLGAEVKAAFLSGEDGTCEAEVDGHHIGLAYKSEIDADGDVSGVVFTVREGGDSAKNAELTSMLAAIDKTQARIEFELDGTIITANDNFLGAVGYSLDEVRGQHHRIFVDPTYGVSAEYREFWASLNRGEFQQNEYKRVGKSGQEIWISAAYNPIFDDAGKVYKIVKYASDITALVHERARAKSIQGVVDNSPNPTMICDRDFNITYANEVSLKTLATLEEFLPIKASEIVGANIDVFHKVPSHQRSILNDPKNLPYDATISVGPEKLRLQVFALYDGAGDYAGPALAWEVITERLAAEEKARADAEQAAQVKAVVDNAPNPTLMLDLETFDVTYANPIAIKTLETLEQYLPIKANEIVGSCIDVFHKQPSHQRKMLADPKNLPHEARIEIGPETLQLQVYALYDDGGRYTGPALAWNIITEQAQMEKRDEAAKRAVNIVQGALADVAQGVIDVQIDEEFDGDLNIMRDNVNNIARVLRRFSEVMSGLSHSAQTGALNNRAEASEFEGAYADIIGGVNDTLDAILTPVANIRAKLAQVATGDLTAYVDEAYEGDHAALKNALNGTLDGLNDLLGQVTSASGQISTSSKQVAAAAQDLSQGASEQAATIEEISAQMGQITAQTTQNAENASQANQLAITARDGAKSGDERMNEMLVAMREIEEASNNISKIIKVIDEIAFQTNLLALNAAVEAARAGVHGKGFAVVAEEVRNLAARSARAAKETTEMIEGSIKKVSFGTNIATETATALGSIVQDVGKVTDLVAEIAAASNEQAEGINQVNSGLDQVNQVTQRNTATAEESAASAEEMSGQTGEMQGMIGRFELREVTASGGVPEGMTPEMMNMLQGYVEKLMGKQAAAQLTAAVPSAPAPATATPEKDQLQISLDSGDLGKY